MKRQQELDYLAWQHPIHKSLVCKKLIFLLDGAINDNTRNDEHVITCSIDNNSSDKNHHFCIIIVMPLIDKLGIQYKRHIATTGGEPGFFIFGPEDVIATISFKHIIPEIVTDLNDEKSQKIDVKIINQFYSRKQEFINGKLGIKLSCMGDWEKGHVNISLCHLSKVSVS